MFTLGKVLLIAAFIVGGLLLGAPSRVFQAQGPPLLQALPSSAFAVGLIYVSFSYSGWNAAVYMAGEIRDPGRLLPRALMSGTLLVTLLYLGLNLVFLGAVPAARLSGVLEVGHVAATGLFGAGAARVLSAIIAIGLISTVGALIMTGPRVYEAMGHDFRRLRFLTGRSEGGGPLIPIVIQAVVCLFMVLTASFDTLLTYIGFTISLVAALTVVGVIVLRQREPDLPRPYRVWGYPLTPLLCVALFGWMSWHTLLLQPLAAVAGLITIALGALLYLLVREPA